MLSGPGDGSEALPRVAGLVVPALGDWCLADRLDDPDLVTRVAAVGPDGPMDLPSPAGASGGRRSSARSGGLLQRMLAEPSRPLRAGAGELAVLAGDPDPRTAGQAALARSLGTVDVLLLGLVVRDHLLGVLTVGRTSRPFEPDEVSLLGDLADLAAVGLEGARLLAGQRGISAAMQASLLPPLPAVEGLTLAARYRPADTDLTVGGDWYDAFVLPQAVGLLIGDATGHDLAASARMAELRSVLRALAVDRGASPAGTLSRLELTASLLATEPSATCLYARVEPGAAGRVLRWSCAGHLPPVLLSGGRARLLETPPELMLGVQAGSVRTDHVHDLQSGDVLVLYTDGLVEERSAHLDAGLDALLRVVAERPGPHPEELCDRLLQQLAGRGEDDVAVLVARVD